MAKRTTKPKQPMRYFICNPKGAIHEVTYGHAKWRIRTLGYSPATPDEIKAYKAANGHQVAGQPIGRVWSPEPEPEPEPEESKEVSAEVAGVRPR